MERLTRTVLRFRWAVLAIWLVLLVASSAAASGLADLLTNRFTLPGTDTAKVEKVLQENFGQVPDGSFTVIARGWI
jgi:putative drug exporter of the RND superfamily